MATTAAVSPSPQARTLFNTMAVVARPYEADVEVLHVDLAGTLTVACRAARAGLSATVEVDELLAQEWIAPAPDGGWLLT